MRTRDERFAEQARHQTKPDPLWNKTPAAKKGALFSPADFTYDDEAKVCICPVGEFLYLNGSQIVIGGREGVKFTGAKRARAPRRHKQIEKGFFYNLNARVERRTARARRALAALTSARTRY